MAFSIETFKAHGLMEGGARPSLFRVTVTFPQTVIAPSARQQLLINAAQLPASIVQEVTVPYFGRIVKYKGDRQFQDWSVTILNDEDFQLRDAFESWQNQMNYLESNIMSEPFVNQGYKQDCFVEQFAKDGVPGTAGGDGKVIRAYDMIGAWPTTVSPINLSWGAQNEIETFEVTFAFDWWQPSGPTVSPELAIV
jgi:hypothetical protein